MLTQNAEHDLLRLTFDAFAAEAKKAAVTHVENEESVVKSVHHPRHGVIVFSRSVDEGMDNVMTTLELFDKYDYDLAAFNSPPGASLRISVVNETGYVRYALAGHPLRSLIGLAIADVMGRMHALRDELREDRGSEPAQRSLALDGNRTEGAEVYVE